MPAPQGEEMTGENPFGFCSESQLTVALSEMTRLFSWLLKSIEKQNSKSKTAPFERRKGCGNPA
jgi:hypothetical protein